MTLTEDFRRHVCQTSDSPNGLQVARAEGCVIYDSRGCCYLDFIAGISVNNVGHCHPRVVQAVTEQAGKYAHTMVYGEHVQEPQVTLAREIACIAPPPLDTTYFLTTGAEANDAALKAALKLTGRNRVCAFHGAYHGDTVGAMACFGDPRFREPFRHLLPPVEFLRFGSLDDLGMISEQTACVIVEPVQGEAGIVVPPEGFLSALRQRCDETGAMLIFDEVQTGFGRLGAWFAASLFGVTPDLITVAKAMGGGLPLAGVIGAHEPMNRFAADPPFSHITTFGGNPISCAAALASLRAIRDEGLLANARETGVYLVERLKEIAGEHPGVRDVRGIGLMIGIELDSATRARQAVNRCRKAGVLIETTLLDERVVRFSPPLVVTREECDTAVSALAASL